MTLGCGHRLETALPADLAALASDFCQVLGEINAAGIGCGSRLGSLLWRLVSRTIYDPLASCFGSRGRLPFATVMTGLKFP